MSQQVAYIHMHSGHATVNLPGGGRVTFHNRIYTTSRSHEVEALDNHGQYGRMFQRVQGPDELERLRDVGLNPTKYQMGPAATMQPRAPRIDKVLPQKPADDAVSVTAPKPRGRRGRK